MDIIIYMCCKNLTTPPPLPLPPVQNQQQQQVPEFRINGFRFCTASGASVCEPLMCVHVIRSERKKTAHFRWKIVSADQLAPVHCGTVQTLENTVSRSTGNESVSDWSFKNIRASSKRTSSRGPHESKLRGRVNDNNYYSSMIMRP
ncbi:hypothetical protein QTP88_024247 [Uroleucon formosanum]